MNLNDFVFIGDITCSNENECRDFHRLLNVIFKRYYVNDFGGPCLKNCKHSQIIPLFKHILQKKRNRVFDIIDLMERIEKLYYDASNVNVGQVYIIDNIKTVKVGASHDALQRFRNLKANGEIFPNATLVVVYNVADQNGFEAKAQALLNKYKAQNPVKAQNRNSQWRLS
ncbi:hypothetical protein B7988_05435 [Fibrobacter sp. UWB1]|uniref:hypothetical protein n=1 Tax=Fibrobacter sp. UWB1 TaxID=1964355 RepID=UPI000B526A08|nr:hypothetical protein [Fibrobacter sp. UWB1]OWV26603.1 hypothetical protein B7988_05435 [Fibrobacter sp. UWB1]